MLSVSNEVIVKTEEVETTFEYATIIKEEPFTIKSSKT